MVQLASSDAQVGDFAALRVVAVVRLFPAPGRGRSQRSWRRGRRGDGCAAGGQDGALEGFPPGHLRLDCLSRQLRQEERMPAIARRWLIGVEDPPSVVVARPAIRTDWERVRLAVDILLNRLWAATDWDSPRSGGWRL